MKLPTDPKERNQILVLIGLVAVGLCVGIFFAFKSLTTSKQVMRDRIEELEGKIQKADLKIKRMVADKRDNDIAVKEILEISNKHILASVLGNYQLVARDILDGYARELGLKMEPVRELGQGAIPYPGGDSAFMGYTARVTLFCGMHDLVKFLNKLETGNPYLCVTGISITQQSDKDPDRHIVSFEVQWPIWAKPEMKDKLNEQLKDDSEPDGGAK